MIRALKVAIVLLPVLAVILLLRACDRGAARTWLREVAPYDRGLTIAVDEQNLIVLGPSKAWGERAGRIALAFRNALRKNYADLLGRGQEQRLVLIGFSTPQAFRSYAREQGMKAVDHLGGYHDPARGAIFLPAGSPLSVLRHETVHLLVSQSYGASFSLSPWLSEGLAQLFETYDPKARPPTPPGVSREAAAEARRMLPEGRIDLPALVGLDDYARFVGEDGPRHYLEALLLTAFLFEEQPREDLLRLLDYEQSSRTGRGEAFFRIYGSRDASFAADLRSFVLRLEGR